MYQWVNNGLKYYNGFLHIMYISMLLYRKTKPRIGPAEHLKK